MMSLSRPCWVMVNNRLSCLGCQEKELTIWEFRTEKAKNRSELTLRVQDWKIKNRYWAHTESSGLKKQKAILSSRSECSGLKNPNPHYLRVQNWKSKQTQSEWSQLKNQKPVLSSQSEYSRQKNQNQHNLSHNWKIKNPYWVYIKLPSVKTQKKTFCN